MAGVPTVTEQAGVGGAELQQLGALARYTQAAIGQAGAPVKAVANANASGTLKFTAAGTANDTFTVGETTLKLVSGTPAAGEVEIGGSATATRDNALAALQAVAAAEGVTVEATSTDTITVTAVAAGVAGNAVALAKSSTAITVSGSGTLAGGVNRVLGTPAPAGAWRSDGTAAWFAVTDCTVDDTSGWKKVTLGAGL